MNKKYFLFGILAIVSLFVFFSILRTRTIPAHRHHHHPKSRLIGGCRGTRYGCCPDSRTACNKDCSNC